MIWGSSKGRYSTHYAWCATETNRSEMCDMFMVFWKTNIISILNIREDRNMAKETNKQKKWSPDPSCGNHSLLSFCPFELLLGSVSETSAVDPVIGRSWRFACKRILWAWYTSLSLLSHCQKPGSWTLSCCKGNLKLQTGLCPGRRETRFYRENSNCNHCPFLR